MIYVALLEMLAATGLLYTSVTLCGTERKAGDVILGLELIVWHMLFALLSCVGGFVLAAYTMLGAAA